MVTERFPFAVCCATPFYPGDLSRFERHMEKQHGDKSLQTALDVLAVLADRTDSLPDWTEPLLAPYRRLHDERRRG